LTCPYPRCSQEAASAKARDLQVAFDELNAPPGKLEAANERLAHLAAEVQKLDAEEIKAEYKTRYRSFLAGEMAQAGFLDAVACRLMTADLRRAVLSELADALESEVAELKTRQRQLSKRLGQKI
jgi:uncharacterized protein YceH (UPF0502 family)